MENQQQSTALTLKLQQAESIKNAVECFIPETDEQKQTLFTKNSLFYLVKSKGYLQDDKVCLPKANGEPLQIDLFEYLQKMYLASKAGLSLIDGDFQFVPFGGKNPTIAIVPDFRAEQKIAEGRGLIISYIHGRADDVVEYLPDPLKHGFTLNSKKQGFDKIKTVNAYTKEVENDDVTWYACVAKVEATGEEFSYVESRENILLRANPATLKFYKDPNAHHTMCEKFVLRQLLKRLPSNLRGVDFDKWLPNFEDAEYEEVAETPKEAPTPKEAKEAKPKTPPKQELKPLVEGSETWFKMIESIKSHKVTIDQIARKYDIEPIRAQIEQLFDTYKEIPEANEKGAETAENTANNESPLNLNL